MPKSHRRVQLEQLFDNDARKAHRFVCTGIVFDIVVAVLGARVSPTDVREREYDWDRGNWALDMAEAILYPDELNRLLRLVIETIQKYQRELLD